LVGGRCSSGTKFRAMPSNFRHLKIFLISNINFYWSIKMKMILSVSGI
jgi:hypothetical protein